MLARTFKTAAELGLRQHEYDALHEVLERLEDGRIPLKDVYMRTFHNSCGTMHCLAGWANVIDRKAFPETLWETGTARVSRGLLSRLPLALSYVFGVTAASDTPDATGTEARHLLRHYLTTGEFDHSWESL